MNFPTRIEVADIGVHGLLSQGWQGQRRHDHPTRAVLRKAIEFEDVRVYPVPVMFIFLPFRGRIDVRDMRS